MADRFTIILDIMKFFLDKQVLITILHFAICICESLINLGEEMKIFLSKKKTCHGNLFMISKIRFPTKDYD